MINIFVCLSNLVTAQTNSIRFEWVSIDGSQRPLTTVFSSDSAKIKELDSIFNIQSYGYEIISNRTLNNLIKVWSKDTILSAPSHSNYCEVTMFNSKGQKSILYIPYNSSNLTIHLPLLNRKRIKRKSRLEMYLSLEALDDELKIQFNRNG